MNEKDSLVDVSAVYKRSSCLAWALMADLIIIVGIVEFIKWKFAPFIGWGPDTARGALRILSFVFGIMLFMGIRPLSRMVLKKGVSDDLAFYVNRLRMVTIFSLVLSEGPAMLGLVLFMLTGSALEFYALLLFSLLSLVANFPRFQEWRDYLEEAGFQFENLNTNSHG